MKPGQIFMQDNAPAHRSRVTERELEERGVQKICWPPFSPDLNPIECVWNMIKNWIERRYPKVGGREYSYDNLRQQVQEAWDAVSPEYLQSLVDSMGVRCQAVIEAEGGYTRF